MEVTASQTKTFSYTPNIGLRVPTMCIPLPMVYTWTCTALGRRSVLVIAVCFSGLYSGQGRSSMCSSAYVVYRKNKITRNHTKNQNVGHCKSVKFGLGISVIDMIAAKSMSPSLFFLPLPHDFQLIHASIRLQPSPLNPASSVRSKSPKPSGNPT